MKTSENNLATSTEIKNRLNPFIAKRLEKIESIDDVWLDELENACKLIISDLNVRDSLAREHIVSYILDERGIEFFGVSR